MTLEFTKDFLIQPKTGGDTPTPPTPPTPTNIIKVTWTGGTMTDDDIFTGGSSATAYVSLLSRPENISSAYSWEFRTYYMHNASMSYGGGTLLGYNGTSDYSVPIVLVSTSSQLALYSSSNGSSWDLTTNWSSASLQNDMTYYIKIGFNGSTYYIDISTTGWDGEFTRICSLTSSTKAYFGTPWILMSRFINGSGGYKLSGSIDIKQTTITVNDTLYGLQVERA